MNKIKKTANDYNRNKGYHFCNRCHIFVDINKDVSHCEDCNICVEGILFVLNNVKIY
jgi:hypothetical protein